LAKTTDYDIETLQIPENKEYSYKEKKCQARYDWRRKVFLIVRLKG